MSPVQVVTDSTAYLPVDLVHAWKITVVPVWVSIAGKGYLETDEVAPGQVAEALSQWQPVTTARPSPADFLAAYGQAAEAGAEAVVSIHISAQMSGTYESALIAARDAPIPVQVLDSESIGMGLGFPVLAAARLAAEGADHSRVVAAAERVMRGSRVLFYVDTLEFLRRGGRMRAATAAVGTALRVKPLLQVSGGKVEPLEKARTTTKALGRLADIVVESAGGEPVDLAVQHLDARQRADELAEVLSARLDVGEVIVSEVGAVVGAHVGPGMVSVATAPRT